MYTSNLVLVYLIILWRIYQCQCNDPYMCKYPGKNKSHIVHQCCTNYIWNGIKCAACEAGKHGRYCKDSCPSGFYGVQCKQPCICGKYAKCDPLKGCICNEGWTGFNCTEKCLDADDDKHCGRTCDCAKLLSSYVTADCRCNNIQVTESLNMTFENKNELTCNCSELSHNLTNHVQDRRETSNSGNIEFNYNVMLLYLLVIAVLFCVVGFVFATLTVTNKHRKSNLKPTLNNEHNANIIQPAADQNERIEGIYDEI